jgi:hypothetical protein
MQSMAGRQLKSIRKSHNKRFQPTLAEPRAAEAIR